MKLHVRIWFAGCGRHHTHYTGSQIHVEDASWCWRRCANNSNLVYSLHCYQLKFQFGHKVHMNCFMLKRFCGHLVIRQYIFCWIVLASYKLCGASPFSEPLGCLAQILLRNPLAFVTIKQSIWACCVLLRGLGEAGGSEGHMGSTSVCPSKIHTTTARGCPGPLGPDLGLASPLHTVFRVRGEG